MTAAHKLVEPSRYAVKLCCAERWVDLVEEVARSLRGMNLDVAIVAGGDARDSLLRETRYATVPTLFVVCVAREEAVVPLRQALSLDAMSSPVIVCPFEPTLPLSIVGEIHSALTDLAAGPIMALSPQPSRPAWRVHFPTRGPQVVGAGASRGYVSESPLPSRPASVHHAAVPAAEPTPVMPRRRPLDFIPDPMPQWRIVTPVMAAAMGVLVAYYGPSLAGEGGVTDAAVAEQILEEDEPPEAVVEPLVPTPEPVKPAEEEGEDESDEGEGKDEAKQADEAPKKAKRKVRPMSPRALKKAKRAQSGLRGSIGDGSVVRSGSHFATVAKGERSWDEAEAVCRKQSINGVGGWRLASRQELRGLDRAGKLPKGAYWTRNRYPVDDLSAYAYVRGQSKLWLKQEPNGAVVCTQPRPRE